MRYRAYVWDNENVLKMDSSGLIAQHRECSCATGFYIGMVKVVNFNFRIFTIHTQKSGRWAESGTFGI